MESVMEEIESLCKKIPESEQMLAIKGIGVITVARFQGDVHRKVLKGTGKTTKK